MAVKRKDGYWVIKATTRTTRIEPLHIYGNAANLEDRTRFFCMGIDLNSQKRTFQFLFCRPDWLHSHDVQGVYSSGSKCTK